MQLDKERFINNVKRDSNYRKFVTREVIDLITQYFSENYERKGYTKLIDNPLEIALEFYRQYKIKYYEMIVDGINNGIIVISSCQTKSYVDRDNNMTFIKLNGNDNDVFILVHEFAHFIDINSSPKIIDDKYWFFSETFAFYFERKLEKYLNSKYDNLKSSRRNNRLFFESKMLEAINIQLFYEDLYKSKSSIDEKDIDIEKMKIVMKYDIDENIVNCLLQYPIANLISDYLVSNDIVKEETNFVKYCLNVDLYELLHKKIK